MQAGKPNKMLQEKLEELAGVPEGFSFDAKATWNRLEEKLKVPKRRKRFLPLYAAAVFLIMAALLLWNLSGPEKRNETVNNQANHSVSINPVKEIRPLQHTSLKAPDITLSKKYLKNTKAIFLKKKGNAMPFVVVGNNKTQREEHNLNTTAPALVDTATAVIASAAQKPKFRIAHINELNNGPVLPNAEQQPHKNKYVFALHQQPTFAGYDATAEEKINLPKKQKSLFGLLNTQ